MGEWERFNQSWRMKWTVECDGCHSKVEVETLTEHPDETEARVKMIRRLRELGWAVNPPHDNCPSCRAQGGYAPLPPASSEHYAQYAVSGSGVTATCSCHWSATSPGMPGARAAMEAHREAVAEDQALCHPAPESMYRDAGFGG
jgi:hypothetical protein